MGTETPDQRTKTKSLVFVDDDISPREAITEVLRNKGFDVRVASDGLEGLLLIRTLRPNFIILDIILPKLDGSRICWLLRQDPQLRNTPIITFSGLAPQDFRRFPELSADAYVAKGPLSLVINNILLALKYVEERGVGNLQGGIFGYEGFRPRHLVSGMVAQKRRYESLLRSLGMGLLELDTDGRILMANAAAATLLGRREARLIAESFATLFPAHDRRGIQDVLEELQRSRTGERVRVTVSLGAEAVSLGVLGTGDEGELTGFLVTIEPVHPERHPGGARADLVGVGPAARRGPPSVAQPSEGSC